MKLIKPATTPIEKMARNLFWGDATFIILVFLFGVIGAFYIKAFNVDIFLCICLTWILSSHSMVMCFIKYTNKHLAVIEKRHI